MSPMPTNDADGTPKEDVATGNDIENPQEIVEEVKKQKKPKPNNKKLRQGKLIIQKVFALHNFCCVNNDPVFFIDLQRRQQPKRPLGVRRRLLT